MRMLRTTMALWAIGFAMVAVQANAAMEEAEGGWSCGAAEDWEAASFHPTQKLALNNFFFQEKELRRTSMTVLEISFSAINRHSDNYLLSGQFAGFGPAGESLFAMSVTKPRYDPITPGAHSITGDVYIENPTISKTATVCALFVVGK